MASELIEGLQGQVVKLGNHWSDSVLPRYTEVGLLAQGFWGGILQSQFSKIQGCGPDYVSSHSHRHCSYADLDCELLWSVTQLHLQAKFFPQGTSKFGHIFLSHCLVFGSWGCDHTILFCKVIQTHRVPTRSFFFLKVYWWALWNILLLLQEYFPPK